MDRYGSGCHKLPLAMHSEARRGCRPKEERGSAHRRSRSALATRTESDPGEQQGRERAYRCGALTTGNRACGFQSRSGADRGLADAHHRANKPDVTVSVRRAGTAAVRRALLHGLAFAVVAAPTVAIGVQRTLRGRAGIPQADKAILTYHPIGTTLGSALAFLAHLVFGAIILRAMPARTAGGVALHLGAGRVGQREDQGQERPGAQAPPSAPFPRSRRHAGYPLAGLLFRVSSAAAGCCTPRAW